MTGNHLPRMCHANGAHVERLSIDLILECERSASGGDTRDCDSARWGRPAWRRYLYAAMHSRALAPLGHLYVLAAPPTLGRPCAPGVDEPPSHSV